MSTRTGNGHKQAAEIPEEQGLVGYQKPPKHTQFQPGQSGNPGGVRKGTVFISERMKYLQSLPLDEFEAYEPPTVADEIAKTRVQNARSKKAQGLAEARELLDRTEGKAPQKVDVSGEINVNVDITFFLGIFDRALADFPQMTPDRVVTIARASKLVEMTGFEEAAQEWIEAQLVEPPDEVQEL